MRFLTGSLWILSLVSLFTDMASEMLYPVMPIYLDSIGYGVVIIGFLEGAAEACAGLSKGYFGRFSDAMGRRVPFVRTGYFLSAVSKPMLAVFANAWWIFFARITDRLGKGVRTGARDAIISSVSLAEDRGKAFGFHRAIDTLGAVLGPLLALIWLRYHPGDYINLFLIAFFPGIISVALTFFLKEPADSGVRVQKKRPGLGAFFSYWKESPVSYKKLSAILLLFYLFNSSDVFLLLLMNQVTSSPSDVIWSYIFYNLIYALAAFPLGMLADRIGLKTVMVSGLIIFSVVYFLFPRVEGFGGFVILFLLYGVYAAATEGIAKGWISLIVPKQEAASAIGGFAAMQSLSALFASALTGVVWYCFGSAVAFGVSAVAALLSAVLLLRFREN